MSEITRSPAPSRAWLRIDALLSFNPKVAALSDAEFRAWILSLCAAKLAQSEGEWPSETYYSAAIGRDYAGHLPALVDAGLIDRDADGWLAMHDWAEWQPKDPTAKERAKRYRDRHRTVTRDDTPVTRDVTPVTRTEERRGDQSRTEESTQAPPPADPDPTDGPAAYFEVTGRYPQPRSDLSDWCRRLASDYGVDPFRIALAEELKRDRNFGDLLTRTQSRLAMKADKEIATKQAKATPKVRASITPKEQAEYERLRREMSGMAQ